MGQKSVVFKNHVMDIYGVLHAPVAAKKKAVPIVVFCHGFTGTKVEPHRIFVKMARDLVSRGIAALRFDFRGSGDSEGNFEDMTLSGEISDAVKALDWVVQNAEQEGLDAERIGLLGLSMGGLVAACTAAKDRRVKALTLWGAVSDLNASLARNQKDRKDSIRDLPGGFVDYGGNLLGPAFFAEFDKIYPVKEIVKFRGPVLIVHGSEDDREPASNANAYFAAISGRHPLNRNVVIEGADHTFNALAWEREVLSSTSDFFVKALI